MNADGRDYKHVELTRRIIGVFFGVYRELGYGFLESVYQSAMAIALREAGLAVEREVELHARFRGRSIGTFRADLLVQGAVIVELKAARTIDSTHIAQLLNYLRCTVIEIGLMRKLPRSSHSDEHSFTCLRSSAAICGHPLPHTYEGPAITARRWPFRGTDRVYALTATGRP
jgi:GxxExxY protein